MNQNLFIDFLEDSPNHQSNLKKKINRQTKHEKFKICTVEFCCILLKQL